MLSNFLKVAFRNIRRHKGYSFINISGLAVGIASFILIMLFVQGELGYDTFHKNADRIYRVSMKFHVGANKFDVAMGPGPLGKALVDEYPEVLDATRLWEGENFSVKYEDKQFREERLVWAEENVFSVFDIDLVDGSSESALSQPNSIVITEAMAEKYFGQSEPIGKVLSVSDGNLYTVSAIARELPSNSHFHFDFLASYSTPNARREADWDNVINCYTYILLSEDANPQALDAKFDDFCRKYLGPVVAQRSGGNWDDFVGAGNNLRFFLQPLKDIHLRSNLKNELEDNGSYSAVIVFSAIAVLILLVACINFVNLATSRSTERANEVGVRKAVGSSRRQLVWQFLSESVFLSTIAVVAAIIIACNFIPLFNSVLATNLSTSFLSDWYFVPATLALILMVGFVAGSYPAFLLSSFRPVSVLKGKYGSSTRGRGFRSVLVVFQFVASIALFIGTIVINNQLNYIKNKELGYNREHIVVLSNADKLMPSQQAFKNEILNSDDVVSATYSNGLPRLRLQARIYQKENTNESELYTIIAMAVDQDFQKTYGIRLVDGRYFDPTRGTDSFAVVLNEAAVSALGLENPIGARLQALDGDEIAFFTVIGVIKNFHLLDLHEEITPTLLASSTTGQSLYLSVLLRPGNPQPALDRIESLWNRFVPDEPVEYVFMDEDIAEDYVQDFRLSKIITSFSTLAIFIACLGLFGLASFTAGRRAKEIGIRKVLGASVPEIILLLSKEFTRWVLLANVIAWPIAYYAMSRWLDEFAYRTDLGFWPFIVGGSAALIIAIVAVSYQAVKAARANPVDSIQYE